MALMLQTLLAPEEALANLRGQDVHSLPGSVEDVAADLDITGNTGKATAGGSFKN